MPQIPALLVDEVDELELYAAAKSHATVHLPRRMVNLPLPEDNRVAYALPSRRWDTDLEEPSQNLRAALRVARKLCKRYLVIDIVSIY